MRPVRLEMEGFTSFPKRVEVDFRNLDLFAITGPTGAGKTSILDAILYVLYGCTPRIGEREIPRLISLGAGSVKVLLEFESTGKLYRVVRTRKTGKGAAQALLEEHLSDQEWRPLCNNIKEIDQRVQSILGLDFEGFTRSVILPQGEFDRFLRGDSKQRTEILKDLLGLRVYERMMRMANERAKELRGQADFQEQQITTTYTDATEENLLVHQEQMADLGRQRMGHLADQAKLESLQPVAQELKQSREEAAQATAELSKARTDLESTVAGGAATEKLLKDCQQKLANVESQLLSSGYDEAAWSELTQAVPLARQQQKLQEELATRRRERQTKTAALPQLEAAGAQSAEALSVARSAHATAKQRASEAGATAAAFQKENGSADLIRTVVRDLESAQEAMSQLPSREKVDAAVLDAEAAVEHLQTIHAAEEIRRHLKPGDACPVCEQVIGRLPESTPPAALAAAQKIVKQMRAVQTEWQRTNDRLQQAQMKAGLRTMADLERSLALDAANRQASADLTTAQNEESRAADAAQTVTQQLQLLQQHVMTMDAEIKRAQDKLREIGAGLQQFPAWAPLPVSELEASLEEQNLARQRRQALEQQRLDAMKQQQTATSQTLELKSRQLSLSNRITEKEAQIEAAKAKAKQTEVALRTQLSDLAPGTDEAAQLQSRLRTLAAMIGMLETNLAKAESKVQEIERRIAESAKIRAEICKKREQSGIYNELGKLLAADEFIGYVQREALSGLALQASGQLSTLSQGRYTLTLGEDKNEFFVIDQWNGNETRSVNTLSGGESFLASLALALALSEGLAGYSDERARSRLDSLFIDEGISSLDPDSLETAITALETLSSGKRMVGVISHVVELGERLPARIHVEKAQGGSKITLHGHSHSMVAGGL